MSFTTSLGSPELDEEDERIIDGFEKVYFNGNTTYPKSKFNIETALADYISRHASSEYKKALAQYEKNFEEYEKRRMTPGPNGEVII